MAKRSTELHNNDDNGDERAVFIDTNLDTHLVLLVSPFDSFSILKQKILLEHPKCFPDYGEIKINALKVKRRGCYYHLLDSMLVKVAFEGISKMWFLFVDASSEIACGRTPIIGHDPVLALTYKPIFTLSDSLKPLKSDDFTLDSDCGMNSCKTENKLDPKMANISSVSKSKFLEDSSKPGVSSGKAHKKRRKKNRIEESHDIKDVNPANIHINDMEHVVSIKNSAIQPNELCGNKDCKTSCVGYPTGNGDVQSLDLKGGQDNIDHSNILSSSFKEVSDHVIHKDMHMNSERKEPLVKESCLEKARNDTKWKKSTDVEISPASLFAEKECKAANDNAQEISLIETRKVTSDPKILTSEPELTANKRDGKDSQNNGLIDVNGLSSKVPKTLKATGKRKMKERQVDHHPLYSDINREEDLKDSQHHAHNASSLATDAVTKVGSVHGSGCVQSLSLHLEDVQKGAYQVEGTNTSSPKLVNNEKENDNVGLARGPRVKKTKKLKKGNGNGDDANYPSGSSKVLDHLKNVVTHSETANRIDDLVENIRATGAETTVQLNDDPKPMSEVEQSANAEGQIEDGIDPLKSLDAKGTSELVNFDKKKRRKSTKNLEKSELCNTENCLDVVNLVSVNAPAEDNGCHQGINEGDGGEDVFNTDQEKATNEIVELGNTTKKKKTKKAKNSATDKPNVAIKDSNEDYNKLKLIGDAGECVIHADVVCSQNVEQEADDTRQTGAESMHPAEKQKPVKDMDLKSDKHKKTACKKQSVLSKDHLEFPLEEQLGEKTRDTQASGLVKKLDKPRATKKKAKNLDLTSSVDVSAAGSKMTTSKNSRRNEKAEDDDPETEDISRSGSESLQPSHVVKPEENAETRSDKLLKSSQRKQSVTKNPPELLIKKQLVEETSEFMPKSAACDFIKDTDVSDNKHHTEVSVGKNLCEEFNEFQVPEVSADLTETRNLAKPQTRKRGAKKLDVSSSVDTSNEPNLINLIKSKGTEGTYEDGTENSKSTPELKHIPQSSAKRSRTSKQGKEDHDRHANSSNSVVKTAILQNQNVSTKQGNKLSGSSSVSLGSSVRGNPDNKKAKELCKKQSDNRVVSKKPAHKNMGEVVNAVTQRKSQLATFGAMFRDESNASSDGDDKMDVSGSTTRTPSNNLSSSDYSEGESGGIVVTSAHDSLKNSGKSRDSKMPGSRKWTLESILRSSSRYKKAKQVASQIQMENGESQPIEFVPDSQPY